MIASAYVEEAVLWAKEIVREESRFPGDHGPAIDRVADKLNLPRRLIRDLHYRAPKEIGTHKWAALGVRYLEEQKKYADWRNRIKAKTPLAKALFGLADSLAGVDSGEDGGMT